MLTTDQTITEIENWFKDCGPGALRPKLLSKLAFIEFCGWIEQWMDQAIREICAAKLKDPDWTEANVIHGTNGFHYSKHFRPMVVRMVGEERTRIAEAEFSRLASMSVEDLSSDLGSHWKLRCDLAHDDMPTHQQKQVNVDAPSWTKNRYRILEKNLEILKAEILKVV